MRWVAALLLTARLAAAQPHAIALHDFTAREDDELSFTRGDRLVLISLSADGEEGWGVGMTPDGQRGLLPLNFVRLLDVGATPQPHGAARAAAPSDALALALAAAAEDSAALERTAERTAAAAALRAYRRRKARYNGPPELAYRWGVAIHEARGGEHAADAVPASGGQQHRSGVGGMPFFNLVEYMEEAELRDELLRSLRAEWFPESAYEPHRGLSAALDKASTADRKVILTFANLGYADFVLNGFSPEVVPNTLVIALDPQAHALFANAGLHSYFDERMPRIDSPAAGHHTAVFMDIMKLRLLYLAEVLALGYSALLTDADAVFFAPPFVVFPEKADLVVACDSTVVPRDWREAPGMVMAGFFFMRAGVRPIIFLKEVLDYQSQHPEQHDQQSFNQACAPPASILSELLVADLAVAVMHPRLFPNGFQYFVKRTVQREGALPLVVQACCNNWMMGADNKRHRFREAHLWTQDGEGYFRGTRETPLRLLRYRPEQPVVSGLWRETSALRAALRRGAAR
ncbi:hypothetical protein AB1Y20_017976 [Prymnesium parvum]|uniref:SH3 domain-containing protein n=1 Tax=Prymnesium parvum TaxID=97485 RepID=A0AB34JQR6_PRYPA